MSNETKLCPACKLNDQWYSDKPNPKCPTCLGTGRVPVEEKDLPVSGATYIDHKGNRVTISPVAQPSLEKGGFIKVTDVTTRPEPLAPTASMQDQKVHLQQGNPEDWTVTPTASKVEGRSLGQIAHQSYQAYRGDSLRWDQIHEDVKQAWERAAQAVADHAVRECAATCEMKLYIDSDATHARALQQQLSIMEARAVAAEASASLNLEHSIQAVEALKEIRDLCQITGLSFEGQSYRATSIAQKFLRLHNQGKGE